MSPQHDSAFAFGKKSEERNYRLCPARLLEGVHWAVSQPLECVRMDSQLEQGGDAEEDEAESLSPSQREARLLCERWSAPQVCLPQGDDEILAFC